MARGSPDEAEREGSGGGHDEEERYFNSAAAATMSSSTLGKEVVVVMVWFIYLGKMELFHGWHDKGTKTNRGTVHGISAYC